jgi:hypothetical protein
MTSDGGVGFPGDGRGRDTRWHEPNRRPARPGVTLERDYAAAARELLAGHLESDGLKARVRSDGVATAIGRIVVDFRIAEITAHAGLVQMPFWAVIDGVDGFVPPRFELDLLGHGPDAHEALRNGVHTLIDGVVPVLRYDHARGLPPEGVRVAPLTSMTAGRPTSWDLIVGPPAIGGEARDELRSAIDDLLLMQGIVDGLTPALGAVRPHWFKVFLVRAPDGALTGDIKVDGTAMGVAASFDTPGWPDGGLLVRQFGLARPVRRSPDAASVDDLRGLDDAAEDTGGRPRSRIQRLRRR